MLHRQFVKIGDGVFQQRLANEALPPLSAVPAAKACRINQLKNCFFMLHLSHRQSHKERLLK